MEEGESGGLVKSKDCGRRKWTYFGQMLPDPHRPILEIFEIPEQRLVDTCSSRHKESQYDSTSVPLHHVYDSGEAGRMIERKKREEEKGALTEIAMPIHVLRSGRSMQVDDGVNPVFGTLLKITARFQHHR